MSTERILQEVAFIVSQRIAGLLSDGTFVGMLQTVLKAWDGIQ